MDENYLNQKLAWVTYRLDQLDQIEAKLVEMKQLAEQARDNKLSDKQIEASNTQLHQLQQEVIVLDEQSKVFWLEVQ